MGKVRDVFNGEQYQSMLHTPMVLKGEQTGAAFFEGKHNVALSLSTDGFCPFKQRKLTTWPIILFNYNLPPKICVHLDNIICIGAVPGPKAPKEMDSFISPLIDELLQLVEGIGTFDASSEKGEAFILCAHLLSVFGDMPAIAKVMWMKGHNGIAPCHCCKITGLWIPDTCSSAHYVPLDQSRHPHVKDDIHVYDAAKLPLWTHDEMLSQAAKVDAVPNITQANRLATKYGINGTPALAQLPSILLPESFPLDFMHLIWENLIPNLVRLWTSEFKELRGGNFELNKTVWKAIG